MKRELFSPSLTHPGVICYFTLIWIPATHYSWRRWLIQNNWDTVWKICSSWRFFVFHFHFMKASCSRQKNSVPIWPLCSQTLLHLSRDNFQTVFFPLQFRWTNPLSMFQFLNYYHLWQWQELLGWLLVCQQGEQVWPSNNVVQHTLWGLKLLKKWSDWDDNAFLPTIAKKLSRIEESKFVSF